MEKVIVAGKPLDLTSLEKKELKGILVDTILELTFINKRLVNLCLRV